MWVLAHRSSPPKGIASNQLCSDLGMRKFINLTQYDWQNWYEIFCICRKCKGSTTFVVGLHDYDARGTFYKPDGLVRFEDSLNTYFKSNGYISIKDHSVIVPPEHLTPNIQRAFAEGASCLAINCPNAATTMFRLCVDLVSRPSTTGLIRCS